MLIRLLFLTLVAGCGGARGPVARQLKTTPPPVSAEPSAEQDTQTPPWHNRTGQWAGVPFSGRPMVFWSKKIGSSVPHPITTNGDLFFAVSSGAIHAFDMGGALQWRTEANADGPVFVAEEGLYVPTAFGVMQLLSPQTGAIMASYGGQSPIQTVPLLLGGTLAWVNDDGVVITPTAQASPALSGPVSDAASDGQRLIVGNALGQVVALSHGGVHWTAQLPGPILFHPIIDGDRVYVCFGLKDGQPGGVASIYLGDGGLIWLTRLRGQPGAAPALGEHLVVPGEDAELIALDRNHGGIRWRSPGPDVFTVQPAVVGDAVYAGDAAGRVHRIDMADGGTVWSLELGSKITAVPAVNGGLIAYGTADGRLIVVGKE